MAFNRDELGIFLKLNDLHNYEQLKIVVLKLRNMQLI